MRCHLVSLLVAFTLTPMMSAPPEAERRDKKVHSQGFLHSVELLYLRMLNWSLAHRAPSF